MKIRKNAPITTMLELLEKLVLSPGSGKVSAQIEFYHMPRILRVVEHFAGDKGHSCERTDLELKIFSEAKRYRYIAGIVEPEYLSDHEFRITELGEKKLLELRDEVKAPVAPADNS